MTAAPAAGRGDLVPSRDGSPLQLERLDLPPAVSTALGSAAFDSLLFVHDGGGTLDGAYDLASGSAALVRAGESATLATGAGLGVVLATVGVEAERHAPIGRPAMTAEEETADSSRATGSRSFQVLFGPENGSERATLFLGYVPPGRAPWHYHLYDEIVFIRSGVARVHRADGAIDDAPAGTAFRLAPREVHIVENTGEDVLVVLGLFTPAGSPSAAYLPPRDPTPQL